MSTAPMDLSDDERKRHEQLRKIVEQETPGTMSERYNAKRELEALQKLSDARAALREIKSRHADMDHNVYCPGHKHDNGDCNCPDTDGLIHEGEPCVDGECECCLSIDVIAQALATPAPIAVPAKITRNESTPEARKWWADAEAASAEVATWPDWKRAGINVAEQRDAPVAAPVIDSITVSPEQYQAIEDAISKPAAPTQALIDLMRGTTTKALEDANMTHRVAPDPVQAAYAECARIADDHDGCTRNLGHGCCDNAGSIKREIEAAALRAGVK